MVDRRLDDLRAAAMQCLGELALQISEAHGELTISVAPAGIVRVLVGLRDDPALRMTTLIDVCGVDYPGREPRFEVVYHLLSISYTSRLRLKAAVPEGETLPSAVDAHPSAEWYEREVFDMYGIEFAGHPDLRRILTDYGFQGHPLRKDFPLTGFVELRYDETRGRVAYEPVRLVQAYRDYDFLSPWEGAAAVRDAGDGERE